MDILIPQLGETVTEGTVSTWFKQVGDEVKQGDDLFEIETDKVTTEIQATADGVLSEIRVATGETAPVGAVVAVISLSGEAAAPAKPEAAPAKPEPVAEARPAPAARPAAAAPPPAPRANGHDGSYPAMQMTPFDEVRTPTGHYGKASDGAALDVRVTPLARRLIAQNGLDLNAIGSSVKAAGRSRINRDDVLSAMAAPRAARAEAPTPTAPAPAAPLQARADETVVELGRIRRKTGENLARAWQTAPHVFQAVDIEFSRVDRLRRAYKPGFSERHGISLTYLPFIARAACLAIRDFPEVNARYDNGRLLVSRRVNLGIAVDLGNQGLVVPVIHDAGDLTVSGLAKAIARLASKARSGDLAADDFADGTYTISNNGAFGTLFTAVIINVPQVAILSTDAIRKRPVVVESEDGDALAIRPVGTLGQSFDHRAFDGAYSAAFLARLKAILEGGNFDNELG